MSQSDQERPESASPESESASTNGRRANAARPRTGRDGRTINTAKIGKQTPRSSKPDGGNTLSRNAYKPRLGHSKPCPMIPLTLPLNNPELAAAALWQEFPASFIKSLVQLLTQRLQNPEGERA